MSNIKVKKDNTPVIYKQDIMDQDGILTVTGCILVIGVVLAALNSAFNCLSKCIVDKDKVN